MKVYTSMIIQAIDRVKEEITDPKFSGYKISNNIITFLEAECGNKWEDRKNFLVKLSEDMDKLTKDNNSLFTKDPNKTQDTTVIGTSDQP